MKPVDDDLNGSIQRQLESLRPNPPRDPDKAKRTRANYIAQVENLASKVSPQLAVSESLLVRLNGWMMQMFSPLIRKERYAMVQILTAFVVVVSMLFGGAGATVYAAQYSLPTDTLYPVKTLSEDMLLVLVNDPQSRLDLVLGYTNRRVEEIVAVMLAGDTIPDEVIDRLQSELDMTLEIAAELEDPELSEAVTKIKIHIRDQDRLIGMTNVPDHAENERVRAEIRMRHQVVAKELDKPLELEFSNELHFRNRLQLNRPVISDTLPISTTETISDTQGIIMEGPVPATGPGPGEPFGPHLALPLRDWP